MVAPIAINDFLSHSAAPREAMLGSWLLEKMPILISGEAGSGKSLFCYSLAYAIASGSSFLGWSAPGPRKVGIFDCEMSDATIQARLAAIIRGSNPYIDPAFFRLLTRDMFGDAEKSFPDLRSKQDLQNVVAAFAGVDLLIVDNVNAAFSGGDESSTAFWTPIENLFWECRRMGMSVILVHHCPKTNRSSPAGSSKNVRVCEVSLVLEKIGDCADGAYFNLFFRKLREQAKDTEPRSARAVTDENGCRWHVGPLVTISEGQHAWIPRAQQLQAGGASYREIASKIGVPKSTVAAGLRSVQVSRTDVSGQLDTEEE